MKGAAIGFATLLLFLTVVCAASVFLALYLFNPSRYSVPASKNPYFEPITYDKSQSDRIRKLIFKKISRAQIKRNLYKLTKRVHVAGSPENLQVMDDLAATYRSYGLEVTTHDYEVFLGFPDYDQPNVIDVKSQPAGDWKRIVNGTGTPLGPPNATDEQTADPRALHWWNAYAKDGNVTGRLVYAARGSDLDYHYLKLHGVEVTGAIVLVRYGAKFRGSLVYDAEKRGAAGVILYTDPAEYGVPPNSTFGPFPDTAFMPAEDTQRGSIERYGSGDAFTSFYPAKPYAFRTRDEAELRRTFRLPNVPVMPIGYGAAKELFQMMDGRPAPTWFQGGIHNVTYRLSSEAVQFRLTVHAKTAPRSLIRNVVAKLPGSEEPDKYVALANHVDAWTYGAQDPNSGTAIILELARAVATVANETGWRPRRSILFCGWDAEEMGIIGSSEWLEEHVKLLNGRLVAVINQDNVKGNLTLRPKGVPLMYRSLYEAAMNVPNPNPDEIAQGRLTVLDSWMQHLGAGNLPGQADLPLIYDAGGGSDFAPFIYYGGFPVADISYFRPPIFQYRLYHSMYETPWTVERFIDPNYDTFAALGMVLIDTARQLADSPIIPFNTTDYALMIGTYLATMKTDLDEAGVNASWIPHLASKLAMLHDASSELLAMSVKFENETSAINDGERQATVSRVVMLNQRLTDLEQCFIESPRVSKKRHVIYSSSGYGARALPRVHAALRSFQSHLAAGNMVAAKSAIRRLQEAISVLQFAIESASLMLDI